MVDVTFDFTSDSLNYWDGFWDRNGGLGKGCSDPDVSSPTLQSYHQELWSKELPNGQTMTLKKGNTYNYLTWDDLRFGSDSIITALRWNRNRKIIDEVIEEKGEGYKKFFEDMIHSSYTIGGMIIFPKHKSSMNQNRGRNRLIDDRWDLTLECIRRYYAGQKSPLYDTIKNDKAFYDLFVDFPGYVNFFFLQDCVSDDYSSVDNWCGNFEFIETGLPKTKEDYYRFLDAEFDFLENRNQRIKRFVDKQQVVSE